MKGLQVVKKELNLSQLSDGGMLLYRENDK